MALTWQQKEEKSKVAHFADRKLVKNSTSYKMDNSQRVLITRGVRAASYVNVKKKKANKTISQLVHGKVKLAGER